MSLSSLKSIKAVIPKQAVNNPLLQMQQCPCFAEPGCWPGLQCQHIVRGRAAVQFRSGEATCVLLWSISHASSLLSSIICSADYHHLAPLPSVSPLPHVDGVVDEGERLSFAPSPVVLVMLPLQLF